MDTITIRQSRKKNLGIVVVTGMLILYYFLGPYEYTRITYSESPTFTLVLGFIFFGIFFYYLKEFIMQPAEIILSTEGIELRDKGWNHWTYISSVSTFTEKDTENYTDREYLVIRLKDDTKLKCLISDLDRSREEIIDSMRKFKSDLIFSVDETS